jgi:ATP-dependent DNA helicase PIF1
VPLADRAEIVANSLKKSYIWKHTTKLKLTKNMRLMYLDEVNAARQIAFSEYLLRVGEGREPVIKELGEDNIQLPNDLIVQPYNPDILIKEIFNKFQVQYKEKDYFLNRAILCTRNATVDDLNMRILNLLPGEPTVYYSIDSPRDDGNKNSRSIFPIELLNSLNYGGMPNHQLCLKENSCVLLLRNLDATHGLCNGTRLIFKNFKPHVIEAEIISGKNIGTRVFLHRITLIPTEDEQNIHFKRKQFPVKLAFAVTINKAKCQTIKKVELFIDNPLFSHGHHYTAMSRVSSINNLKIMVEPKIMNKKSGFYINNVVYNEIL